MSQPHLLPGPTADLWDWQLQGACRGENSDVFYHPDGERGRARAQRENLSLIHISEPTRPY